MKEKIRTWFKQTKTRILEFLIRRSFVKKIKQILGKNIKRNKMSSKSIFKRNIKENLWVQYYSEINGIVSDGYIPENIFYSIIEKTANKVEFSHAHEDKNNLGKSIKYFDIPNQLINNINGFFYHKGILIDKEEALKIIGDYNGDLIIKPSIDTGGGKGVGLLNINSKKMLFNNNQITIENLLKKYKKDFIVQEKIQQNEKLAAINNSSVNTFRVISHLDSGGQVEILSTVLRMGTNNSIVDNQASGGISIGVKRTGGLNDFAISKYGKKFYKHPSSNVEFGKVSFPQVINLYELIKKSHKLLPYFKLISWDIALDKNEKFVLIEFNTIGQEINFHQANNGPVLKVLTQYIPTKFFRRKRSNPRN